MLLSPPTPQRSSKVRNDPKQMKTLRLKSTEKEDIKKAAEILKNGGLAAIPTETVYGLAANALDPVAVGKIFAAKGRPQDNPLIVHVASLDAIPPLVKKVDPRMLKLAERFWPGPLTIISERSEIVPDAVTAGLSTVAIRMPSHPCARAIIEQSGLPLAAPSANASGKPSPTCAEHVLADLDGRIDAVVDGGHCSVGVESTVITLATEPPTLLRPGGVTVEQLREVLGEVNIAAAVFEKLKDGERPQSPGMKYKHYAPAAEVTIIKGSFKQYKKFLLSAGKTRSSILISAGARMAPFDIREVRELMEDDELELDTIGDEKTALFLIMSDTDTTFNFILAMVQSQLINLLCDRADDKYGGRLPVHVRMILDEFANSVTRSTPKTVGITDKSVA